MWWGLWGLAVGLDYGWIITLWSPVSLTLGMKFSSIPMLEERFKDDADYQQYQREVSALLPMKPRSQ